MTLKNGSMVTSKNYLLVVKSLQKSTTNLNIILVKISS